MVCARCPCIALLVSYDWDSVPQILTVHQITCSGMHPGRQGQMSAGCAGEMKLADFGLARVFGSPNAGRYTDQAGAQSQANKAYVHAVSSHRLVLHAVQPAAAAHNTILRCCWRCLSAVLCELAARRLGHVLHRPCEN